MSTSIQSYKCPRCGHQSYYYDSVSRHMKEEQGAKSWHDIHRNHCLACGHYFRVLPDAFVKFKHYRRDIIEGFVSGKLSTDQPDYDILPCDKTVENWRMRKVYNLYSGKHI